MDKILNKEFKKNSCSESFIKKFINKTPKNIFGLFFIFTLIILGSLVFSREASAATYCMRADGTAANLAAATGPDSNSSACISSGTHNGLSGAGAPQSGDIIQISSAGGTYATAPSLKFAGVTYTAYPSETPTINNTVTVSANNVTLSGVSLTGGSSYNLTNSGTPTGVTFSNLSIITTQSYGVYLTAGTYSINNLSGSSAVTFVRIAGASSINIDGLTSTASQTGSGLWFSVACPNVVVNNITISNKVGAAVIITDTTNMTFTGSNWNISSSNTSHNDGGAVYYLGVGATNVKLQLIGLTIDSSIGGGGGLRFYPGAVFTSDSKIDQFNISNPGTYNGIQILNGQNLSITNGIINGGGYGISIDQGDNTTITSNKIYNNSDTGIHVFNTTGTSNNIKINYNWIYNNGYPDTNLSVGNHDGIDMHTNCSNETINNNIIVGNGNAGLALVLNSNGVVYNNIIANNGTIDSTTRGGFYNSGAATWTLKNNIFINNYTNEIAINSGDATVSNYNIFFHNRDSNPLFYIMNTDTGYTLAQWQTSFSQDINSLNVDPLLLNTSGSYSTPSDFQLQPTSPAIDSGFNLGTTYQLGISPGSVWPLSVSTLNQNSYGPGWEIGAYVYNTQPTAPTVSISTPSTGAISASVSVTATAGATAPATISSVQFYLDGVALQSPVTISPYTINWNTTGADGVHTLTAVATDNYNNTTTSTGVVVTVDTTAPVVTFSIPTTSNSLTVIFTSFSATDANTITGYLVNETATTPAIDDTGWAGTTQTQYIFTSDEGAKTLYAWAKDSVGNISTSGSGTVTVTLPIQVPSIINHTSSGSSVSSQFNNLVAMGNLQAAQELVQQFPNQISNNQIPPSTPTTPIITLTPSTPLTLLRILKLVTPRMWGDDVLELQTLLNTKGYDSGTPDGNFGPKTQSAVIAFQKANGLVLDGSVGPNTLKYLNGNQTNTNTSTAIQPAVTRILKLLVPRMIGDDVLNLQTYLNTNGYDVGSLDGVFGSKTYSAVIAFQTANGLTFDGIVGAKTREMMK